MLLQMLMMAYHNLGVSLTRKSEAGSNTCTNTTNKIYKAGSISSNKASRQSTLTVVSVITDQEELLLAQHAFDHANAIRNRLALTEHKNIVKKNNFNTSISNTEETSNANKLKNL